MLLRLNISIKDLFLKKKKRNALYSVPSIIFI